MKHRNSGCVQERPYRVFKIGKQTLAISDIEDSEILRAVLNKFKIDYEVRTVYAHRKEQAVRMR